MWTRNLNYFLFCPWTVLARFMILYLYCFGIELEVKICFQVRLATLPSFGWYFLKARPCSSSRYALFLANVGLDFFLSKLCYSMFNCLFWSTFKCVVVQLRKLPILTIMIAKVLGFTILLAYFLTLFSSLLRI